MSLPGYPQFCSVYGCGIPTAVILKGMWLCPGCAVKAQLGTLRRLSKTQEQDQRLPTPVERTTLTRR